MERLTRAKAIRAKCLDCCYDDRKLVKQCTATNCPLWIYRLGREIAQDGTELPKKRKPTRKNKVLNGD